MWFHPGSVQTVNHFRHRSRPVPVVPLVLPVRPVPVVLLVLLVLPALLVLWLQSAPRVLPALLVL